jgi:hypothetical protein
MIDRGSLGGKRENLKQENFSRQLGVVLASSRLLKI